MEIFFNTFIFIFGAMMGSAANALIDRLPRGESWFAGRSHCDKCKHVLEWKDLIPIVSYLSLSGNCRYCGKPIPYRNTVVEILMGLAFVLLTTHNSLLTSQTIILMGIIWVTAIIAVMDWETKLVSEVLVIIWLVLVVVGQLLANGNTIYDIRYTIFIPNIWGLLAGVGMIGGIWAVTRGKAMGFGDVEIAAVMGWWLGWPSIVTALWIAFVSGAIVGSYKLLIHKMKMKSEIAFGPFLVMGAWGGWLWGGQIMKLLGFF